MKKISLFLALVMTLILGVLVGIKIQKEVQISAIQPDEIEGVFRLMEARYQTKINRNEVIQKTIDRLKKENKTDSIYQPSKRLQRINEQVDIRPSHRR